MTPAAPIQACYRLHVYTDGSASTHAGSQQEGSSAGWVGGWAFAIIGAMRDGSYTFVGSQHGPISSHEARALGADYVSNNSAELVAAVQALRWLAAHSAVICADVVVVWPDSMLTVDIAQGRAAAAPHQKLQAALLATVRDFPATYSQAWAAFRVAASE
eukprot:12980394-Alexandrium_andersonii.AAC.1